MSERSSTRCIGVPERLPGGGRRRSPSGPTHDIDDVTSWRFVFDDTRDAGHPMIIFAPGRPASWNATVTTKKGVWVGSQLLTKPRP